MTKRMSVVLAVGLFGAGCAGALAVTSPLGLEPREDASPSARVTGPAPGGPSAAVGERAQSSNPLWTIPLRQLTATRERPLFTPSRRPAPPVVANAYQLASVPAAPPPKPAEPEKPQLALVGTVAGDGDGFGVFIDQAAKSVLRLKTGEHHKGWVLRAVHRRDVVFEKGTETAVLELPAPDMTKVAAPAMPAGLAAPRPAAGLAGPPSPTGATPSRSGTPVSFNPFPLPSGVRPTTEPTTFNPFKK